MNETVVQEIAKQLGIAVDQAGNFISTYLPQYAGLQVMYGITAIIGVIATIITVAIIFFVSLFIYIRANKENRQPLGEFGDYISGMVTWISGIFFIVVLIAGIITLAISIPNIIGWMNYPEGMLINEAIMAIQH